MSRIFNRALTTDEVKQLASEGTRPTYTQYTMDNITGCSKLESAEDIMCIPANGKIVVGNTTMSGSEFETCLTMLRKLAMKEMPEEFI